MPTPKYINYIFLNLYIICFFKKFLYDRFDKDFYLKKQLLSNYLKKSKSLTLLKK